MKKFLILTLLLSFQLSLSAENSKKLTKEAALAKTETLINSRHNESKVKYADEWESRLLRNGSDTMKFWYKVFGEKPADGRALYISMHGGGGAPAEVNDGQWDNQKKLYTPAEGVYFVPRAPSDTWNLWHQEYMDGFVEKIIELASIYEDINPNKVYVMGYSAGGDGTFQLAPRLADKWAAAAMSAGHPGDAQIESLRNLPFELFMGGLDSAYNRNGLARAWAVKHDSLAKTDKGAYINDVHIYEQHGHWMKRDDTLSMAWMPQFIRNSVPDRVVWVQDDVARSRFYWLQATDMGTNQGEKIVASYTEGRIDISECTPSSVIVCINDKMMNLDKPVSIYYKGKLIFKGKVPRRESNIKSDVDAMRDKELVFPAKLKIINGENVQVL